MLDIFYSIQPEVLIYSLMFLILFAIMNFGLMRILKQKTASAVIAICASILAIYGVNKASWDLTSWIYQIGLSESMLYTILPILILIGIIYLIKKTGLGFALMTIGGIILGITFTDLIYEKIITFVIGILIFIIGLWGYWRKRKRFLEANMTPKELEDYKQRWARMNEKEKRKFSRKEQKRMARIEAMGQMGGKLGRAYGKTKWHAKRTSKWFWIIPLGIIIGIILGGIISPVVAIVLIGLIIIIFILWKIFKRKSPTGYTTTPSIDQMEWSTNTTQ